MLCHHVAICYFMWTGVLQAATVNFILIVILSFFSWSYSIVNVQLSSFCFFHELKQLN